MEHHRQLQLVERISENRACRTTDMATDAYVNPVEKYTSPDRHRLELQLLRTLPLVACLSCDVKRPGDFITVRVLDVSVIVVRGSDDVVRAFHNICSHRGSTLVDGRGHSETGFRCPFHAWSYGLDGRLRAIANSEGFDGVPLDRDGALIPLACNETAGVVFVRVSGGGELDTDVFMAGMAHELSEYSLESFHPLESRVSHHAMNWKLMADTFLESYHIPYLHRETFHPVLRQDQVWDAYGLHSRNVSPRYDINKLDALPPDERQLPKHAVIGYNIFPNVNLTFGTDHFVLFRIHPVDVEHCYAEVTWYTPVEPHSEREHLHWRRTIDFASKVTENEDFATGDAIQRNLRAGALTSTTFGRNEVGLIHFHKSLDDLVGDPTTAGWPVPKEPT